MIYYKPIWPASGNRRRAVKVPWTPIVYLMYYREVLGGCTTLTILNGRPGNNSEKSTAHFSHARITIDMEETPRGRYRSGRLIRYNTTIMVILWYDDADDGAYEYDIYETHSYVDNILWVPILRIDDRFPLYFKRTCIGVHDWNAGECYILHCCRWRNVHGIPTRYT